MHLFLCSSLQEKICFLHPRKLLHIHSWGNLCSYLGYVGVLLFVLSYVSTLYLCICVSLLGFLKTRGWVDSCAMVYWRRDLRKRKVGEVQWGREWNWARLWPPADPRRLWSMSYTTELVPPVVRESVSHSPLCGGGAGRVCCNLQMRRI